MALTAKERQAKRRAKVKASQETSKIFLEKDRVRKAIERARKNSCMTDEDKEEFYRKERERVQKYRDSKTKKETITDASKTTPYKSVQACGKAVKKVNLSLPKSPKKRLFLIQTFAKLAGLPVDKTKESSSKHQSAISESLEKEVLDFYQNDEVSWQAPGKKDRVIIREVDAEGKKQKGTKQVRYMLMSLSEAFRLFVSTHANLKIGHSKFCQLRPPNIKLFDHIPHNVCVCSYHENVRLLLVSLKGEIEFATDLTSFIDQVTCDSTSKECMTRKCTICTSLIQNFQPRNPASKLQLYQWKTQNGEKVEKVLTECSAEEVFLELSRQLTPFLLHTYIKRCQAAHLNQLTASCDLTNIVIQVDFSENATILDQNEIQSAHWNHGQATLFTAHAWLHKEKRENIVLISDCLNHTKYSVYVYINYIVSYLKEHYPTIEVINFFSDGASSQFKQRFLFANLHQWEVLHKVNIRWNFFATSHGKGVVDGLGGTVKRSVWRYVRSGKIVISSAKEYAVTASQRNPNIHIHFVPESTISDKIIELDSHWKGVLPILRTQKLHCVYPSGPFNINVSDVSNTPEKLLVPIRKDCEKPTAEDVEPTDVEVVYSIGHWVIVRYDNIEYRGEISKIINDDVQVNVMHKSETGNYWKWPEQRDNIFYKKCDIIKVIDPPTIFNSRGLYKF